MGAARRYTGPQPQWDDVAKLKERQADCLEQFGFPPGYPSVRGAWIEGVQYGGRYNRPFLATQSAVPRPHAPPAVVDVTFLHPKARRPKTPARIAEARCFGGVVADVGSLSPFRRAMLQVRCLPRTRLLTRVSQPAGHLPLPTRCTHPTLKAGALSHTTAR